MSREIEREILSHKSSADRILEKTALELEILLKEACISLRPFPSFPNAFFTNAIECDPNGLIENGEHGCIVVTENGELNELDFGDEVGVLVDLVHVHGAAEDDEAVVGGQARARVGFAPEVDVADAKARLF